MKRQDKYPDTKYFHYHNSNPWNRITPDCIYRALSTALEMVYSDVVMQLADLQCETGYADMQLVERFLKGKGWIKHKQPRKEDNTKYTGKEFCEYCARNDLDGRIFAHIGGGHVVAIVDCKVYDTWDSTNGCIGNYWMKGEV